MVQGGRNSAVHPDRALPPTSTTFASISTTTRRMGGGSGANPRLLYSKSPSRATTATHANGSMNGPVDRVYHFTKDSHQAKKVTSSLTRNNKNNRSRAGSGGTSSTENHSGSGSYETIDGSAGSQHKKSTPPLPPPPGLRNVGNSCYANAALQCLLSTALPHALLDERNAHIIRRHSFNRKLLVHGSGSVDSADQESSDREDGSTFGSYLSGTSGIYEDHEEEDDIILARAMGELPDHYDGLGGGLRASPSRSAARRKRLSKKQKDDDATIGSCSSLHSDMYKVMKRREQKAEKPDSEEDLLCAWLTQELTQITREYTTPPQRFVSERREKRKGGKNGRGSSPTNFLGGFFGGKNNNNGSGNNNASNNRIVDPGSITRHVHKISPCLRPYQQEDSHEFFRSLLSSLTMHGQNARLSSLFDGLLESSVQCKTCGKTSLTRDRYMDLSLDIADKSVNTLERALEKFTEEETLSDDNMVTCSRCKVKRPVTKGLRLATAPTMLVINFKRFACDNYGRLSRLSKQVHFPIRLDIADYMSRANRGKPPPYTLVAVLVHRGRSCDCGHYFAYVRKGKDWYLANDAEVTKVDVEEVLRAQAYVLVYEVAGMKEKHNFDCYSRYHRSLDEADEESMARENNRGNRDGMTSWDFSSFTSLLEACDAGLCGSLGNVMDSAADPADRTPTSLNIKHSLEEESPTRNSGNDGSSKPPKHSNRNKTLMNIDTTHAKSNYRAEQFHRGDGDVIKAYYKRGRSHTPSRQSRSRDSHPYNQPQQDRKRELSLDFDPHSGVRRAKSLSRVDKFKMKRVEPAGGRGVAGSSPDQQRRARSKSRTRRPGGSGGSKQKLQPSRRRVPSRPKERNVDPPTGQIVLPPLHEYKRGSSTRGMML